MPVLRIIKSISQIRHSKDVVKSLNDVLAASWAGNQNRWTYVFVWAGKASVRLRQLLLGSLGTDWYSPLTESTGMREQPRTSRKVHSLKSWRREERFRSSSEQRKGSNDGYKQQEMTNVYAFEISTLLSDLVRLVAFWLGFVDLAAKLHHWEVSMAKKTRLSTWSWHWVKRALRSR